MIMSLLGTLFGGLFRLAPAVMEFFDKKDERKHELAMLDKQLAVDAARAQQNMDLASLQGSIDLDKLDVTALTEAVKIQGQLTGVKWVDGLNALMRPLITFWWVIVLYTAALGAEFYTLWFLSNEPVAKAIMGVFGEDEKAIAASIISFWFVDRALRKRK